MDTSEKTIKQNYVARSGRRDVLKCYEHYTCIVIDSISYTFVTAIGGTEVFVLFSHKRQSHVEKVGTASNKKEFIEVVKASIEKDTLAKINKEIN